MSRDSCKISLDLIALLPVCGLVMFGQFLMILVEGSSSDFDVTAYHFNCG